MPISIIFSSYSPKQFTVGVLNATVGGVGGGGGGGGGGSLPTSTEKKLCC